MSILVSKEVSGPQESSAVIRFCLKKHFQWQKFNYPLKICFLYTFLKSFVFMDEEVMKRGHLSAILFMFLDFPYLIQWQNTFLGHIHSNSITLTLLIYCKRRRVAFWIYALFIMHDTLRIMQYALYNTHYVLCITHYAFHIYSSLLM